MSCCENRYDLCVKQGATFTLTTTYKVNGSAVDLSAYTARMQLRQTYESASATLELTTENGGISVGSDGSVVIIMTATQTAALNANITYVYDIELVYGSTVIRYLQGNVKVSAQVTR